ncbi:hypothetical protein NMK71_01010 [Weeksellaceae bacterium KMM 9713]|uniref:Uncharacterized protein n=1 Tax=Profundicola chukchiensis TaxID=2961959 RepID=A0A9X4RVP8_9FLAO|nr:hypothetical protein [Profundicola chukchiensis]MDG4944982.1 hypothetical protein [Profundicola chukchiensis]
MTKIDQRIKRGKLYGNSSQELLEILCRSINDIHGVELTSKIKKNEYVIARQQFYFLAKFNDLATFKHLAIYTSQSMSNAFKSVKTAQLNAESCNDYDRKLNESQKLFIKRIKLIHQSK